ncbi:C40 family peptidase [Roseateles sp. BYS180W]|uniref:C40 family peptidase n=1 Tax=Roseateles rivi TaxID=3299028 RepID=A0ABW7FSR6_9BURK
MSDLISSSTTKAVAWLAHLSVGAALLLTVSAAKAQSAQPAPPKPAASAAGSLTPPPGTMMGAYGQSLAQQQPAADASSSGDVITRFLMERNLIPGANNPVLAQVRDTASDLVMAAMNFLGVPYKLGGKSIDSGFDCSGFTRHIFEISLGLILPPRAEEQARLSSLIPIRREDLKPGDLVFFNTMRRTFSHVGIYVGEGKFIHAPRTGAAVRVEDMRESYWATRFTGARRADVAAADPNADPRKPR